MEYKDLGKFDMIAVRWESNSGKRRSGKNLGLAFIEMKYMDESLDNGSGIIKHLNDLETFLSDGSNIVKIKEEMKKVFNQKKELGIINNVHSIENFNDNKPEIILLLANHDPEKPKLKKVLEQISEVEYEEFDIKFAVSNFMGYGLYAQNMFSLDKFRERFNDQIYCKKYNFKAYITKKDR